MTNEYEFNLNYCSLDGKVSWSTKGEAQKILARARTQAKNRGRKNKKKPTRVYKCTHCGEWHLTSKK